MSELSLVDSRLEAMLGFDRVRRTIADRCSSEYAVERALNEQFSTDVHVIKHRLLLTDEMRLVMMFEESFPDSGYIDCLPFLKILRKEGSNIDLLSLGKLRTILETMRKIVLFFHGVKDGVYPKLKRLSSDIQLYPEVEKRIDLILDKYGNVRDSASTQLSEIRTRLKEKEGSVSRRANAILRAAQQEGIVDSEAGISIRDGRMLIPVSTANKRSIQGLVYDVSATGKTTYIEPAEIVELENEINELRFSESREILRILSEFSEFVRPYVPGLIKGAGVVGEMDFIMAKAQVALDYIAGMPIISEEGQMHLRKARHPLLEKTLKKEGRKLVPLTASLVPSKHILLISGPNAGGKSVCLKTVGLLQYMFQWGMLVPTSETSEMMVFDRIMAAIGDNQSIDNDLSTYSAFLVSMREMLAHSDAKTLVLIDELGSGTEPAAGGAIAEAILGELDRRGVYGVITTHYSNLKLYAAGQNSGVMNGAMQFDAKNIEPLFVLEMGLPGNSFAFELARKMGLPEKIIQDAEARAGEEYVGIERNLRHIARSRRVLDEKLQRIRQTDKTLESITDKYQKELEGIRQQKKEILDEARSEAEEIVRGANKQVESTIKTIKEAQAEKERTIQARKELQSFVEAISRKKESEEKNKEDYLEIKLNKLKERQKKEAVRKARRAGDGTGVANSEEELQYERPEVFREGPLKVGEKVRVKDNGMVGEVSKLSAKSVTVIIGNISSSMSPSKLERISSNEYKAAIKESQKSSQSRIVEDSSISNRKLGFRTEIDLRGQRVGEAINQVVRYVDDAMMLSVPSVRIIHGKGTGALREEIQKLLRTIPGIASVRDEDIQFGGTGVTVVTFG